MKPRDKLDISKYLIIGPENTLGRNPVEIIRSALEAGFTCLQIRSKEASALELIKLIKNASDLIGAMDLRDQVTLLVNDRLDLALAAMDRGARVDGIHLGQGDLPVDFCRKYLGDDLVIGLSAGPKEVQKLIDQNQLENIDYFGVGPLHPTKTKLDTARDKEGNPLTRSLEDLKKLKETSPLPLVVGGGVKLEDLQALAQTGVDGFFVISAITAAENPGQMAKVMVDGWEKGVNNR